MHHLSLRYVFSHLKESIAIWDGKKIVVYEISGDSALIRPAGECQEKLSTSFRTEITDIFPRNGAEKSGTLYNIVVTRVIVWSCFSRLLYLYRYGQYGVVTLLCLRTEPVHTRTGQGPGSDFPGKRESTALGSRFWVLMSWLSISPFVCISPSCGGKFCDLILTGHREAAVVVHRARRRSCVHGNLRPFSRYRQLERVPENLRFISTVSIAIMRVNFSSDQILKQKHACTHASNFNMLQRSQAAN